MVRHVTYNTPMTKTRYYVRTWDAELQQYTPQRGVRCGPWSLWGLRKAIRKLRSMGYGCEYSSDMGYWSDPAVLIQRGK